MGKTKVITFICLFFVIFVIAVNQPTLSKEVCPETWPDPGSEESYCQSGGFIIKGSPMIVNIFCDDTDICATFQFERYEGELGCCANNDCRECLLPMDEGENGRFWSSISSSADETWCGDGTGSQWWPEYVHWWSGYDCTGTHQQFQVNSPPSFCGVCYEDDVCIEFDTLFNPCGLDPDCLGTCCSFFDIWPDACWDVCGDNLFFLIRCLDKATCGDVKCTTW